VEGEDHGVSTNDDIFANGVGGRLFRANNRSSVDVFTLFDSGEVDATGPAFIGSQSASVGVAGIGNEGIDGTNTNTAGAVAVYANGVGGSEYLFVGNNSHTQNVFTVDDAGNVHAHSFISDLAASGPHGSSTYSTQVHTPTIEDFGEARLTAGMAYVPLKGSFTSGIDRNEPYLVFITPQGAVRGSLYVAQKDARGFSVREAGGASSIAFDYRIVAKPILAQNASAMRLPQPTAASKLLPHFAPTQAGKKVVPAMKIHPPQ